MDEAKEKTILIRAIEKFLSNKPLHEKMKTVPRFERYFLGPGKKSHDMNELGHAINTYKIAKELSQIDLNNHLNEQEYFRLLVCALIHDFGELETGDISYDSKTSIHEEMEVLAFKQKISHFFPGITEQEKEIVFSIYENIAQEKTKQPKEAKYFNLIEKIGYLLTALEQFTNKPLDVNWSWLCCNTIHNQGNHLLCYLQEFSSAKIYLKSRKKTLEEMVVYFQSQRTELRDIVEEDWKIWGEILKIL